MCAWSALEHTGLLVADMVPLSDDSVFRLRVVTVSLVHTMGWTQCRVLLSQLVASALQILLLFHVKQPPEAFSYCWKMFVTPKKQPLLIKVE